MSAHNKSIVLEFINGKREKLKQLKKFKDATTDDDIMNRMKLTEDNIRILTTLFDVVDVPKNTMFAHTESMCIRGDVNPDTASVDVSKFWELTPSVYNGTMSCTSCWSNSDIVQNQRNSGKKFNISANTTFLGKYYDCFGRLLIYRGNDNIKMLNLGVSNLYGRKVFTYIVTRMILGNDYYLDLRGKGFENPQDYCVGSGCTGDCTTGLWSHLGALYEKVWGYFFELAFLENKMSTRIGGIIINDASNDKHENLYVSGTEFRVFSVEALFTLESVLYNDTFYLNKDIYRTTLEKDIRTYNPTAPRLLDKRPNSTIGDNVDNLLSTYCGNREKFGFITNIFDRPMDTSLPNKGKFKVTHVPVMTFDDATMKSLSYGQATHGYEKYKKKYFSTQQK